MLGFGVVRLPERAEAGIASAAGVRTLVECGCGFYRSGEAGDCRASSTIQGGFVPKGVVCYYSFHPEFDTRFFPSYCSSYVSG